MHKTTTSAFNVTPRLFFPQSFRKPVTATFEGGQVVTDSGLLLLQQAEERMGLISGMAEEIRDSRDSRRVRHALEEMLCQRIYAISAGSEDCNDHNTLCRDPLYKLVAGRSPEDPNATLASQPSLSRFENQVSKNELLRMGESMARTVIANLDVETKSIVLDIDASEDKTHGNQQYVLFNTHTGSVCYFPLFLHLTDDKGRQYVLGGLLRRGAVGQQGTRYLLRKAVQLLRERFPQIQITVRADAGFGGDKIFTRCESLETEYVIRFPGNESLKKLAAGFREDALCQYEHPREEFMEEVLPPVEHYGTFYWKAKEWKKARRIIVKTVVTSPEKVAQYFAVVNKEEVPQDLFRFYHGRGEQENRIKEIKCDLASDRTSCHRFEANQFRLLLHCASNMLFNNLKYAIEQVAPYSKYARAQISTLQRDLIKAGARIIEKCKHVWVHISSTYLHHDLWRQLHAWHLSGFG